MSNIYELFEQRKEGITMLEEGYGYIEPDDSIDFDTIEEGIDLLEYMAEELSNDVIKVCAENYVTDLCLEDALYEDFDSFVEGDYLTEAEAEKSQKADGLIKRKWKEFKAWIRKIIETVKNFFMNGEKLGKKYNLKARLAKCTKKVKCHDYNSSDSALNNVQKTLDYLKDGAIAKSISAGEDGYKEKCFGLIGVKDKKALKDRIQKYFISTPKPTEKVVNQMNIGIIIDYATNKKSLINAIKKMESNVDASFKEAQDQLKKEKSEQSGEDAKKTGKVLKAFNFIYGLKSSVISMSIGLVKSISRNCLAICRKAVGGSVANDNEFAEYKAEPTKPEPTKALPAPKGGPRKALPDGRKEGQKQLKPPYKKSKRKANPPKVIALSAGVPSEESYLDISFEDDYDYYDDDYGYANYESGYDESSYDDYDDYGYDDDFEW